MNISKEGVDITNRFFEAIEVLKKSKRMRGLLTFTKAHNINYWNISTVRDNPETSVLKPEWIAYLVNDYKISTDWLITGRGQMFGNSCDAEYIIECCNNIINEVKNR